MYHNNDKSGAAYERVHPTKVLEAFPLQTKGEYWWDTIQEYNNDRLQGSIVFEEITLTIPVHKTPPAYWRIPLLRRMFLFFYGHDTYINHSFIIDTDPKKLKPSERNVGRVSFYTTEEAVRAFEEKMQGFSHDTQHQLSFSAMPEYVTNDKYSYRASISLSYISEITIQKTTP